ncbi:putative transcriptional regulator [Frankia sp. EI5c]|uniref:helix-turn-helix domain-containing protein n=1 Tax=Frankia sp. EI5c TaxID=683316 RepID=UPI0007C3F5AC|nr:helix-turn-helix transcriptional regulator [Frankia sp. EI5c]OAA23266.1 putative transcriptional regulator [Frankia sp. EI5c]
MDGNELGAFLRTRREAVSPTEVGLPVGARRRTPGLRRSEVATLAGVSVEYVTRLEQGRDRHPSPAVLSTLAGVLRLTPRERVHLYRLSKGATPGFTCQGGAAPAAVVRPALRALLESLEPAAAVMLNRMSDLLTWTPAFERLVRPIGLLDDSRTGAVPNLARFVFTDGRARSAWPDWNRVADDVVATLKQGPFRADRYLAALADELTLTAGPAFSARLASVPGLPAANGVTRLAHPSAGELRLAFETLELPADDDLRVVVHLPADAATATALDGLREGRRGSLRAISGTDRRKVRPA